MFIIIELTGEWSGALDFRSDAALDSPFSGNEIDDHIASETPFFYAPGDDWEVITSFAHGGGQTHIIVGHRTDDPISAEFSTIGFQALTRLDLLTQLRLFYSPLVYHFADSGPTPQGHGIDVAGVVKWDVVTTTESPITINFGAMASANNLLVGFVFELGAQGVFTVSPEMTAVFSQGGGNFLPTWFYGKLNQNNITLTFSDIAEGTELTVLLMELEYQEI